MLIEIKRKQLVRPLENSERVANDVRRIIILNKIINFIPII